MLARLSDVLIDERSASPAERRPAARARAHRRIPRALSSPPAWTLTAALAVAYLIIAPASPDLAAASYRSDLFARVGFSLWDNSWYGGHHLLAYSVLAPALGALIGPRLVAAASLTVAAAVFEGLIDGPFPPRASRVAALWFAFGAGIALLSSRVPFDLGVALGLGALALARSHRLAALSLCLLCSLASPVAGAFLALALFAWALAGGERRWALSLAAAAAAPVLALALVFPEGGTQPFVASSFFPALAGVLVLLAFVPRERRALLIGLVLYALLLVAAYTVPSPLGGNADRLGALLAAPLAALLAIDHPGRSPCALPGWSIAPRARLWLLVALAPLLLWWQVTAPLGDLEAVTGNPSVSASYYAPLVAELRALHVGYGARPARVEVVPSASHWEARWVAPHVMLARGWERQLDTERNGVFYSSRPLTAGSYGVWLLAQSVSLVALPDAPLDYSGAAEARLLRGRLPSYLREIWHSAHWRLFAVLGASPLASPPAVVRSVGLDSVTLELPRAGSYTVRVRFTPYWALVAGSGCVARAAGPQGWTRISAPGAERARLGIRFSLARVLEHGPRCA